MNGKFGIVSPVDGALFHEGVFASDSELDHTVGAARSAARVWKNTPLSDRRAER